MIQNTDETGGGTPSEITTEEPKKASLKVVPLLKPKSKEKPETVFSKSMELLLEAERNAEDFGEVDSVFVVVCGSERMQVAPVVRVPMTTAYAVGVLECAKQVLLSENIGD
jgi:hypothetical protein